MREQGRLRRRSLRRGRAVHREGSPGDVMGHRFLGLPGTGFARDGGVAGADGVDIHGFGLGAVFGRDLSSREVA